MGHGNPYGLVLPTSQNAFDKTIPHAELASVIAKISKHRRVDVIIHACFAGKIGVLTGTRDIHGHPSCAEQR